MRFGFVTLFPETIAAHMGSSILGRATARGLVSWATSNPREFAYDGHRKTDDVPYGGEAGMLMKAEPVALALAALLGSPAGGREDLPLGTAIVVTEPGGRRFDQALARDLAGLERAIFVCGHYEGIDHRFEEAFATHVLSLGDFVLTGGELPALVMADAIARNVPGVLGSAGSLAADSFGASGEVSAPNYTRPPQWRGRAVPEVLLNGNHSGIAAWREAESARRTGVRDGDCASSDRLKDLLAYDAWANERLLSVAAIAGGRAAAIAEHIRGANAVWLARVGAADFGGAVRAGGTNRRVVYRNSRGEPFEDALGEIIVHVANHGTYHRGQIRAELERAGAEFPETDWILWRRLGSPQAADVRPAVA